MKSGTISQYCRESRYSRRDPSDIFALLADDPAVFSTAPASIIKNKEPCRLQSSSKFIWLFLLFHYGLLCMRRTKKLQIGSMYRYDATTTLAIGHRRLPEEQLRRSTTEPAVPAQPPYFFQIDCKSFIIWISFLCRADGSA